MRVKVVLSCVQHGVLNIIQSKMTVWIATSRAFGYRTLDRISRWIWGTWFRIRGRTWIAWRGQMGGFCPR